MYTRDQMLKMTHGFTDWAAVINDYRTKHYKLRPDKKGRLRANHGEIMISLSQKTGIHVTHLYSLRRNVCEPHERNELRLIQLALDENLPCIASLKQLI